MQSRLSDSALWPHRSQYLSLMLKTLLRNCVDSRAPSLGRYYRRLRDGQVAEPPFEFKFKGSPRMGAGLYETEEIAVFLQYLKQCSTCIDIGANVGMYSCLAQSHGKHAIAFEPLAENLSYLYENLLSNEFLDVEVYPLGLSDTVGLQRLYGSGINASLLRGWARAREDRYSVVPTNTLDNIVGARFGGVPLMIKLDVEGFELQVLKGAERTLSLSPNPCWMVEIVLTEQIPGGLNDKFYETFEIFWKHGYKARTADRNQRPVFPADVERWASSGLRDFGSYNYLFLGQ
jgi:FkbM family methyltransferase